MPIASASTDRDPNSDQILTIFVCNWREPPGTQPRAHFFRGQGPDQGPDQGLVSPDFASAEAKGRALEVEFVEMLKSWLASKGFQEYEFMARTRPEARPESKKESISLEDLGL